MKVSVLVPYKPDGGRREQTWGWLQERWEALYPAWEIVTGEPSDPCPDPGRFNRPQAINAAAARASGDVFVVNDCDTGFTSTFLDAAVGAVADGVPWVMPQTYLKLTEEITDEVLAGRPDVHDLPTGPVEWQGDTSVAGLLVLPREAFELVGGFDERHHGGGWDDISFFAAVDTLWGSYERLPGFCHHLWHPQPHEHSFGQATNAEQQALFYRYDAARGNPDAMRALIGERP